MTKKSSKKNYEKHIVRSKKRSLGYVFRISLLPTFVGVAIYIAGAFFFTPQGPCANSLTCKSDLSVHIDNGVKGIFEGKIVNPPIINSAKEVLLPSVLGASTSAEKHIYVDLSTQILYAYQGNDKFMQTLIASGRWNPTPVGNFHIWEKLISTRMAGGEGPDAYDLPNVPYVMYFYNDFGLHGAYWHDAFGTPMSHGCVNMRQIDAKKLYEWADGPFNGRQGTKVSICNHFTGPDDCQQDNPINS